MSSMETDCSLGRSAFTGIEAPLSSDNKETLSVSLGRWTRILCRRETGESAQWLILVSGLHYQEDAGARSRHSMEPPHPACGASRTWPPVHHGLARSRPLD